MEFIIFVTWLPSSILVAVHLRKCALKILGRVQLLLLLGLPFATSGCIGLDLAKAVVAGLALADVVHTSVRISDEIGNAADRERQASRMTKDAMQRAIMTRDFYRTCMEGRGYEVRDDLSAVKMIMGPGERQRDQSECAVLAAH